MAISSTPTGYSNGCTGRLAAKVSATLATGWTVTADSFKTPAGTGAVTWPTGNQLWKVSRKTRTETQVEYIGVESLSQTGTAITTGAVIRYMSPTDGTSFASVSSTGLSFAAGSIIELVWTVQHAENTVFKNNDNTIATGKKIYLGDTGNYITGTASGDISIASNTTAVKTFAQLAAASGSDEKVKISSADTTTQYLEDALLAGTGINLTKNNSGANETLTIGFDINPTDPGLEINGNYVRVKKSTNGLVRDSNGMGLPAVGTSGNVMLSNGTVWASGAANYCKTVYMSSASSAAIGATSTSIIAFDTHTLAIDANTLVAGVGYEFDIAGTVTWAAGTSTIHVMLGSTVISDARVTPGGTGKFHAQGKIMGTTSAGAAAAVHGTISYNYSFGDGSAKSSGPSTVTANVATNGALTLQFGHEFGTSNGSNNAVLYDVVIKKISTTAF